MSTRWKLPVERKWWILHWLLGGPGAARAVGMHVGADCRILSCSVDAEPWLVTIGDHVTVSTEVLFITHDGSGWLFNDEEGRRFRYAPIAVGRDSFIGVRAIVMPGVRIGQRCIVGSGAVVTKSVPDGSIVAGNPARIVGLYDEFGDRALRTWPTELQRVGNSYAEQVGSIVDTEWRPSL